MLCVWVWVWGKCDGEKKGEGKRRGGCTWIGLIVDGVSYLR